jgi:hypothetical protein
MWFWLVSGFIAALTALLVSAGYVAVFNPSAERRKGGYRVLKLVLRTAAGIAAVVVYALYRARGA